MGMGQNLIPMVNIKIAGKWMFTPLKMVLIGIDPYPNEEPKSTIPLFKPQLPSHHGITFFVAQFGGNA